MASGLRFRGTYSAVGLTAPRRAHASRPSPVRCCGEEVQVLGSIRYASHTARSIAFGNEKGKRNSDAP